VLSIILQISDTRSPQALKASRFKKAIKLFKMFQGAVFDAGYPLNFDEVPNAAHEVQLTKQMYSKGIDATINFLYREDHYVSGCVLMKTNLLGDRVTLYPYIPSRDQRTKPTAVHRQLFASHGDTGKVVLSVSVSNETKFCL
jgi:hypothetical protein